MEQQKKFKIKLNLFDSIVIVLALAIGGLVVWQNLSVERANLAKTTVRYVVRIDQMPDGTSHLVKQGGTLVDVIKNYEMGTIVSAEVVPSTSRLVNPITRQIETVEMTGHENVYALVESPATHDDSKIVLGGGYEIRVGADVYMRGEGYMAAGYITQILREGDLP